MRLEINCPAKNNSQQRHLTQNKKSASNLRVVALKQDNGFESALFENSGIGIGKEFPKR